MSFLIPVDTRTNPYEQDELFFFRDNIDILTSYSINTRLDDKKIRNHFIRYAIHREFIPKDHVDDCAESYYSNNQVSYVPKAPSTQPDNNSQIPFTSPQGGSSTTNSATDTASMVDSPPAHTSAGPTSSSSTILSSPPAFHVTEIRTIHETVTKITVDPITSQVHHTVTSIQRNDLLPQGIATPTSTCAAIEPPLFTYGRIFDYVRSKIMASKSLFDSDGLHNMCQSSISYRYVASLKRMMDHEIKVKKLPKINAGSFKQIIDALESLGKQCNLPNTIKVFFPITRTLLSYFSLVYPNGVSWFPMFMSYCCIYQLGVRNTSMTNLRWGDITYYRRFMYQDDPDELREIALTISYCKKKMSQSSYPLVLVGYRAISTAHGKYLLTNPDVLFWLQMMLFEKEGMSLEELLVERGSSIQLSTARYTRIANRHIFSFNDTDSVTTTTPSARTCDMNDQRLRQRADSISITMNEHIKEVAKYCGMSNRVIDSITIHHSLRQGMAVESEATLRNEDTSSHSYVQRNLQGGWSARSKVPQSIYDISHISQHFTYANTRFGIVSNGLPKHRDESVFVGSNETFSYKHLVEMIKGTNNVEDCVFKDINDTTSSFYCEENIDLVQMIWSAMIKNMSTSIEGEPSITSVQTAATKLVSTSSSHFKRAVRLAVREKSGTLYSIGPHTIVDEFILARPIFLSYLNFRRRDEMAEYIIQALEPYSDSSNTVLQQQAILSSRLSHTGKHMNTSESTLQSPAASAQSSVKNPSVEVTTPNHQQPVLDMKKPSDDLIKKHMNNITGASLEELNSWVLLMNNATTLRPMTSSSKRLVNYTLYNILSFLLYGSITSSQSLHSRACSIGYNSIFDIFLNRISEKDEKEYKQAVENRVKGKSISIEAVEELEACCKKCPSILQIYGWARLLISLCPKARNDGIVPQQLKDFPTSFFTKQIKGCTNPSLSQQPTQPPMLAGQSERMDHTPVLTRGQGYLLNRQGQSSNEQHAATLSGIGNPTSISEGNNPTEVIHDDYSLIIASAQGVNSKDDGVIQNTVSSYDDSSGIMKDILEDAEDTHGNNEEINNARLVDTSTAARKECERESITFPSQGEDNGIPDKKRKRTYPAVTMGRIMHARRVLRNSDKKSITQKNDVVDVIDMTNTDDEEEVE
jgi:hypothetical protein